jgi:pimeloyl-ACP methyl ester carboxylesterase
MPRLRVVTKATVMLTIVALIAGCAGSRPPTPPGTTSASEAAATAPPTLDPASNPSIEGSFAVGDSGMELALVCWGEGSPTVVLETGGPNIEQWVGSGMVQALASTTRVCTYDRPGTGASDPPPDELRDADDAIATLKELLMVAEVDGPFVLLGRSFGGMIVTHYAAEHPDDVVGVVVLDTPAPSDQWSETDKEELSWDNPGNTERLDVLNGFEIRFAHDPPQFDLPLLLVSPIPGEASPENEAFWLGSSPQAEQVTPSCADPTAGDCATVVLAFVEKLASGG